MGNIVRMLPESSEVLELMLGVEDYCFMVVVECLGTCLVELSDLCGNGDVRETKVSKHEGELM